MEAAAASGRPAASSSGTTVTAVDSGSMRGTGGAMTVAGASCDEPVPVVSCMQCDHFARSSDLIRSSSLLSSSQSETNVRLKGSNVYEKIGELGGMGESQVAKTQTCIYASGYLSRPDGVDLEKR